MQLHSQSVIYTIHYKPNKCPFVVHIEDPRVSEYRSHVIGFEKKQHAYQVAKMLEYHKNKNGSWPSTEISTTQKFDILVNDKNDLPKKLQDLYVETWNFEDLQAYMALNIFHMMYIDEMSEQFRSYVFVYDYPPAYIRHRLEIDI